MSTGERLPGAQCLSDGTWIVERHEDMSKLGRLRLIKQPDGDIIVAVIEDPDAEPGRMGGSVEFCTVGSGGGRSPRTRKALQWLFEAMKLDNHLSPHGEPEFP